MLVTVMFYYGGAEGPDVEGAVQLRVAPIKTIVTEHAGGVGTERPSGDRTPCVRREHCPDTPADLIEPNPTAKAGASPRTRR